MSKFEHKIAVIGGGSWATALVKLFCNTQTKTGWWVRKQEYVEHIQQYGHNPNYLQAAHFEVDKLNVSTDLQKIIAPADIVVMAVPSAFVHGVFEGVEPSLLQGKIIIGAIKGFVPQFHAIPARYFHKQFGVPYEQIGIICGPCHAEEVALERLSYLTIACQNQDYATQVAKALECRFIKTSISDDIFGTELSAVLKNVYAIAAGIYNGLGYGDNFQAVLVANAIREIERFVDAVSPVHRDVKSSAYLGDLLVTAYSQFSRNRTLGNMIGKGYTVISAKMEMEMIAEGFYAVKSVMEVNKKFKVDLPICESVYRVLYEKMSPAIEMTLLAGKLK